MTPIVSVFGGSAPQPGTPPYAEAQVLGAALARAGWTVATGGYYGVMEAASRGAAEAGGHVIGVTCGRIEDWKGLRANAWVKEEQRFDNLRARLSHLVEFCDAAVALPGGVGTLSEVALTWSLIQTGEIKRKPLITVGRLWHATMTTFIEHSNGYLHAGDEKLLVLARDVDEAVAALAHEAGAAR